MKIGIDLSITKISNAGTAIYANSLVHTLQQVGRSHEYTFFAVNHHHEMGTEKTLATRLNTLYRDIIWTHAVLPARAAQAKVDLLHMPANIIPLVTHCPTVVSILDTIVFQMPHSFPLWQRNYARAVIPLAAKKASIILTISEHSKRDIVERFRVDPSKVVVTYLAAAPEFQRISNTGVASVCQKYNLEQPFILTVGTLEPRKNISRLLQAYAQLRQKGLTLPLVHAGPAGWMFDEILAEAERQKLGDSVHFLGRIPQHDLVALLNAAELFVYPSLYEGFGLPVLEAMACGCPVITSNISSLPEIVGDAGCLIDPYDVVQLADSMYLLLTNPELRLKLREKGIARAQAFSWDACAQLTLAAYDRIYAMNG